MPTEPALRLRRRTDGTVVYESGPQEYLATPPLIARLVADGKTTVRDDALVFVIADGGEVVYSPVEPAPADGSPRRFVRQ